MIWVERGNPVTQNPETNTVLEGLSKARFSRVVVEQFMTDTAREADIVLPAKTMFEQSDVIGAYWHPYIQLKQKVLEPPGEVKPEIGGVPLACRTPRYLPASDVDAAIPAPVDAAVDAWLASKLAPFPELTLERLRAGPMHRAGTARKWRSPT